MIDFSLYLITDRKQIRLQTLGTVIERALRGGIKAIQLREKDLSSRALYDLAVEMRRLTSQHGAKLFINDRIDICLAVNADGVHLGGESIPVISARRLLGREKFIGVSCHDGLTALAAEQDGADFITFGPVFHTASKARYGDPVGIMALSETAKLLRIPVFGLGGIKKENTREVIAAQAHGIALISAVIAADDPESEAAELVSLLQDGK